MLHSFRPFKGTVQWYYDLQLDLNNGPNQDVVTWQLLPFKETLSPSQLWFLFWKLMEIVFRGFGICICLFWFDLTFIWQGKSKLSFDMIIILIETHKAQGKGLQILVGQFLLLSFANSNYSNSFSSSLSWSVRHTLWYHYQVRHLKGFQTLSETYLNKWSQRDQQLTSSSSYQFKTW